MRYVDLITAHDIPTALGLMRDGWHMAGASRSHEAVGSIVSDKGWIFLLGMPLHAELVYDPDTRTYSEEVGHGRGLLGSERDSGDHGAS